MIDQIGEDIALLKNRLETCRNPRIQQVWKEDLVRLAKRRFEFKALVAAIREHRDLAERLDLIYSVSGRRAADRSRHPGAHARDRPAHP